MQKIFLIILFLLTSVLNASEDEKVSIQLGDNKSKELYFNFEYKINKKDENNFFVDFKPTVIKKLLKKVQKQN